MMNFKFKGLKLNTGKGFFLYLFSFLLLLCAPGQYGNIPNIKMNVNILGIILILVCLVALIINGLKKEKVKFDTIGILLSIRAIYYLVIEIMQGDSQYLSSLVTVFLGVFVYIWAINADLSQSIILRWVEVVVFVLQLETIIKTCSLLFQNIQLYQLKEMIQIPFGGSNYLAATWLMFFPLIYKLEENKKRKMFFLCSTIFSTVLTRSNTGLIILALLLVLLVIQEKRYKGLKICGIILVAIIGIYIIVRMNSEYLVRAQDAFISLLNGESRVGLNGRVELYKSVWEIIKNHPIFGVGFLYRNYTLDNYTAHNWILEIMASGGIIALFIFVLCLINIYLKIRTTDCNNKQRTQAFILCFFAVLCQGLIEPTLGSFRFDMFFWVLVGFAVTEKKSNGYMCDK